MMRNAEFIVKIEGQFSMTREEMYRKLRGWLELYGHTAAEYGFEFKEIRKIGENDE